MKLSDMKTQGELLDERLRDPEFRAEWERTALARAVAITVVRYRAEHDLSQRQLAERLDMPQPQVARLESGDVNPRMETLMQLASKLGTEFTIDIRPARSEVKNVKKAAAAAHTVGHIETDEADVLVLAAA